MADPSTERDRADVAAFDEGESAAFDPQPAASGPVSGDLVTGVTSWWHTRFCRGCGHTFRRGDRVVVDAGEARHLAPGLGCAGGDASAADGTGVADFTGGLLATWPVADDLPVTRTDDAPGLLAPPLGGLRRATCLFCAHTFRPGEVVVVCPCGPLARRCGRAVHRDPSLGLTCWENWRPGSRIAICPVTLTRVRA